MKKLFKNLINKFAYRLCGHTPYREKKEIIPCGFKSSYPEGYNPDKMDFMSILR